MTRRPRVVEIYRALLVLLPRAVRQQDGREIGDTFAEQWQAAFVERRRLRVLRRAFVGLAGAVVLEWWDTLHAPPALPERRRPIMDGVLLPLRQSVRSLARTPSFAWTAVLLLGLGVGQCHDDLHGGGPRGVAVAAVSACGTAVQGAERLALGSGVRGPATVPVCGGVGGSIHG